MENINIALLQIESTDDLKENIQIGIDACRKAKDKKADIAVFPEMWNNGYKLSYDKSKLSELAVYKNSEYVNTFKELAKTLNMAIAITYLMKDLKNDVEVYYNTVTLFDRFGEEVYTYSKVHTCDFDIESVLERGNDFYVDILNTEKGNISVGSMICYDREFPESARILMLKGAELLIVPNACPMEINRISQLRGRAFENMLAIVTVNYPCSHIDCNGHSTVFDGVVYKEGLSGSRDCLVYEAKEEAGVYVVSLSMDDVRNNRQSEIHGNCFRRPKLYGKLLEESINEPFIRKQYRK